MKLTKKKYENALEKIAEASKAQQVVKAWDQAMKSLGKKYEGLNVIEIEIPDSGKPIAKCQEMEDDDVDDQSSRKSA